MRVSTRSSVKKRRMDHVTPTEAHYALAFLYAMNDRETGADHFWRAMELAVPDERGLAEKYYGTR